MSSDTGADWSARRSHPREVLDGLPWIGVLYPPTDHPFTRLLMRVDWDFDPSLGSRHFTGVAVSAITKTVLMSEALASNYNVPTSARPTSGRYDISRLYWDLKRIERQIPARSKPFGVKHEQAARCCPLFPIPTQHDRRVGSFCACDIHGVQGSFVRFANVKPLAEPRKLPLSGLRANGVSYRPPGASDLC